MNRLADALEVLRAQVNKKWPARSKTSDGWIGDASHQSRSSDHNPWIADGTHWVVSAIDITHDPEHGFDSYKFADMLLKNKDARIKYVISNKRIGSGSDGPQPWTWRPYNGSNAHDHHVHISVKSTKEFYDNKKEWKLDTLASTPPAQPKIVHPVISLGMTSKDVPYVHEVLGMKPYEYFGASSMRAVQALQDAAGLTPTGIVDGATWALLEAKKSWS